MHQVEYITCYVEGSRVSWGVNVGPGWFIEAHRWQQLTDVGEHPRAADPADAVIERGRAIAATHLAYGCVVARRDRLVEVRWRTLHAVQANEPGARRTALPTSAGSASLGSAQLELELPAIPHCWRL